MTPLFEEFNGICYCLMECPFLEAVANPNLIHGECSLTALDLHYYDGFIATCQNDDSIEEDE